MRQLAQICFLCCLFLGGSVVFAQDKVEVGPDAAEYHIESGSWQGLSTLRALAQGAGLEVVQYQEVHWGEVGNTDILFLIYPTSSVDSGQVAQFIRNGGRVLVADDFGHSSHLIKRLGGTLVPNAHSQRYYKNQRFSPIATGQGHALTKAVDGLTSNHPAALTHLQGAQPVFSFDEKHSLVAAGSMGAGRYVLLSDPSVLINRMLQFEGNLNFAINLLRYLRSGPNTARLVILSGDLYLRGRPHNFISDGSWNGEIGALVAMLDGWLDELNSWRFTNAALRVLAVIFGALLCLFAFWSIPRRRYSKLDGNWTRMATLSEEPSSNNDNFLEFAVLQRDHLDRKLGNILKVESPLFALSKQELCSRLSRQGREQSAKLLGQVLPKLRNLPERSQLSSAAWQGKKLHQRDFEKLFATCDRLRHSLNLSDPLR